jgi:PAS domain S-box-containing protein
MSVYFEDITARKQTEDRVKWLASFPELNPSPVVEADLSGNVYYLNPAAKHLLPDLESVGPTHVWLADLAGLAGLSQTLQTGDTSALTREIAYGSAVYQQSLYYVPDAQRVRIYAVDLTARKRAEDALRKSEEKYRLLFENLSEGFALYELVRDGEGQAVDWRVLEVNDAYTKHTGVARSSIVGKRISELFPAALPEYLPRFARVVAEQTPIDFETHAVAVNRFQHVTTFPAKGDRFASIIEDITDRKRAEEQLQLLSTALEATVAGVALTDRQGRILWVNPAFSNLTGYSRDEVRGQNPRVLKSGEHDAEFYQELWRTILSGRSWNGEMLNRRKDGTLYYEEMTITPVRAGSDDITHFVAIKEDITPRKLMEEQLRNTQLVLEQRVLERTAELDAANAELRLQSAALQAAANGILITDRQGNIQWANPALAEITGYAVEELKGQSTRLFRSGLKEPAYYQHLWDTIVAGQTWRGELTNRRKDGSLYVEEQTIAPVWNEWGEIANFVAVKQDVTQRREEQARLEQTNRELQILSSAERHARQVAEILSAASLALTKSLDVETVMEGLLDYLYQLVPYDSANIMLLETEERLVVRATRGYEKWTDSQLTGTISFDAQGHQIFREMITAQTSILISDTSEHPDWDGRPSARHVRSWIGVPIVAGGQVIGIYSLDKTIANFFVTEHVQLTEALAGQAAVAIQNAWLFNQLRAGRERLQSLSRRLVEIQEAERLYVARELHDEAGQALTALVYGLGELERETSPEQRSRRLTDLKKMTHEVLESLHHLAMDLRPASLDFLGLVPALNQYVKVTGERYGLNAQFKVVGLPEERMPAAMETALYRIVQEALTNVIRHAQATRVDVLLECRNEQVVLVVEDNGRGFESDQTEQVQAGHLGLVGMQERAEMLGGTLVIESAPNSGTTIVIEVPYAYTHSHR